MMNTLLRRRNKMVRACGGVVRALALGGLLGGASLLTGCTTGYSADVRNQTPQPLFVDAYYVTPQGERIGLGGARLGPGDRGGLGPYAVRNDALVSVSIDTVPNPQRPAIVDLRPGLNAMEVTQGGNTTSGPLQIRELR